MMMDAVLPVAPAGVPPAPGPGAEAAASAGFARALAMLASSVEPEAPTAGPGGVPSSAPRGVGLAALAAGLPSLATLAAGDPPAATNPRLAPKAGPLAAPVPARAPAPPSAMAAAYDAAAPSELLAVVAVPTGTDTLAADLAAPVVPVFLLAAVTTAAPSEDVSMPAPNASRTADAGPVGAIHPDATAAAGGNDSLSPAAAAPISVPPGGNARRGILPRLAPDRVVAAEPGGGSPPGAAAGTAPPAARRERAKALGSGQNPDGPPLAASPAAVPSALPTPPMTAPPVPASMARETVAGADDPRPAPPGGDVATRPPLATPVPRESAGSARPGRRAVAVDAPEARPSPADPTAPARPTPPVKAVPPVVAPVPLAVPMPAADSGTNVTGLAPSGQPLAVSSRDDPGVAEPPVARQVDAAGPQVGRSDLGVPAVSGPVSAAAPVTIAPVAPDSIGLVARAIPSAVVTPLTASAQRAASASGSGSDRPAGPAPVPGVPALAPQARPVEPAAPPPLPPQHHPVRADGPDAIRPGRTLAAVATRSPAPLPAGTGNEPGAAPSLPQPMPLATPVVVASPAMAALPMASLPDAPPAPALRRRDPPVDALGAAMAVASERLGLVRIGLAGGAEDLRVAMSLPSQDAAASLAGAAPQLTQDLAQQGVRLESLSITAGAPAANATSAAPAASAASAASAATVDNGGVGAGGQGGSGGQSGPGGHPQQPAHGRPASNRTAPPPSTHSADRYA